MVSVAPDATFRNPLIRQVRSLVQVVLTVMSVVTSVRVGPDVVTVTSDEKAEVTPFRTAATRYR